MLQVILQALDFLLVGEADVFLGDIRRLAEAGIVAGQRINHAAEKNVRVVNRAHDVVLIMSYGPNTPSHHLDGIANLLAVDDEGTALFDERFQRFGDEIFQIRFAARRRDEWSACFRRAS